MPRKYFTEEERKAADRASLAKYRAKPENKIKEREYNAARLADPEYKAKQRARDAARWADPEVKAKQRKSKAAYRKTSKGLRNRIKTGWRRQGIKFASEFDREIWVALSLYDGTVCEVTGMTNAEHLVAYGCRLSLDHDHQTGEPRRFVARHINTALGAIEGLTPEQLTNLLRLHEEDRRTRDDLA